MPSGSSLSSLPHEYLQLFNLAYGQSTASALYLNRISKCTRHFVPETRVGWVVVHIVPNYHAGKGNVYLTTMFASIMHGTVSISDDYVILSTTLVYFFYIFWGSSHLDILSYLVLTV